MGDAATTTTRERMTRNAWWCAGGFAGAGVLLVAVVLLVPTQRSYLLHGAPGHDAVVSEVHPAAVDSCKGSISTRYDVVVEWQRDGRPVTASGSWCADDPPRIGSARRVWERTDGTVASSSPAAMRVAIGVVLAAFLLIGALGSWSWLRARPPLPPDPGRR